MMSEEKSDFKQFEVAVRIEASNTFRVQAAIRKRAEEIALDTAREDAKRLEAWTPIWVPYSLSSEGAGPPGVAPIILMGRGL
jgi:1,2-phenylacetyl-CoA epoxidase PaaB subunit